MLQRLVLGVRLLVWELSWGGLVLGLGKWEVMVGVICVKGSVGSTGCVCCCCSSSGGEVRMRLVQSDPRTLHHPCSFISWMVRYFS